MRQPIYFGGATGAASQTPEKPLVLSKKYIPLESMTTAERHQVFGLWLGIVYVNREESFHREPNWGTYAEEDPMLVWDFHKSYEAGDWKKLDRGLFVGEMCLSTELTNGAKLMCLFHPDVDDEPLGRMKRKRLSSPVDMADMAARYFALKAGTPRHGIIAMCTDDRESGHCVALLDADPAGELFAYADPWPGRSLYCEEENVAGVKAISLGRRPIRRGGPEVNLWQITREELESIVVALIFQAKDWEELTGETVE